MPPAPHHKTFLIISQVYVPDPAAVGQHIADAAAEMARRGYSVRVLTSGRGYDDPTVKFPPREVRDGVDVRRLPLSSFGKRSIPVRLAGQSLFLAQAILRGIFTPRLAGILVSTSPPMCSVAALIISFFRRVPVKYWVMDINPDQMIAMKKIGEHSLPARAFNALNRMILKRASDVIVLDRFMAQRINAKREVSSKLAVMPPWPHEGELEPIAHGHNPFRKSHNLDGTFVVMYSGNHSPANPITTILDAAERLQDDPRLVFMFIGGGAGKKEVDDRIARGVKNIRSLPYQPLSQIKYSLSAADLHIVSIGDAVVGIVHPCKVYGAMAVARPVLLLGPDPCHVSDIIQQHQIGWRLHHGDVDGAVRILKEAMAHPGLLASKGQDAAGVIRHSLGKAALCARFCDVLERGLSSAPTNTVVRRA
jgi:colanic acid biosynthesis glycosyl transferase WcaI